MKLPTPKENAVALRKYGHRLVDQMADYLEGVESRPVSTPKGMRELAQLFAEPLPRVSRPADEVWDDVWNLVVKDSIHLAHPMYAGHQVAPPLPQAVLAEMFASMGFLDHPARGSENTSVPHNGNLEHLMDMGHQVAPPLPHAVLADALASLLNQSLAVWEMSPTGTVVEAQVMRWLVSAAGFPATAEGTLVSGGSVANLTGLLAAREARFRGSWTDGIARTADAERAALVVSGHSHYSVERTAGLMGLGSEAVVSVADRGGKMDPAALHDALRSLKREGRIPFAVSATAGSTATGLFDPLDKVADVCASEGVWMHVDGAHGASFLLSDTLRHLVRGIERADSIAWDPHKMLWMPMSTGAVLVRDGRHLNDAFRQKAPYLFHARPGEDRSWDAGRMTLQCSRRFDALKLWVSLQHYGADHFAGLLETTVRTTHSLHAKLAAAPDFQPEHAPESNILCFRHLPERGDDFQAELRRRYNESGTGWITTTVLNGRRVLRVTLMNPHTADEHLDRLLDGLREVGRGIA